MPNLPKPSDLLDSLTRFSKMFLRGGPQTTKAATIAVYFIGTVTPIFYAFTQGVVYYIVFAAVVGGAIFGMVLSRIVVLVDRNVDQR